MSNKKETEKLDSKVAVLPSRPMTCSTSPSGIAERITPELREYLEIELAKRIAAKAYLDLQIQMLEVALSLQPK